MKSNGYFYPNLLGSSTHLKFNGWFWKSYPQTQKFHHIPIHFAGSRATSGVYYCWWLKTCTTWDIWNPINNGINYQPQLVSRISAINSSFSPCNFWISFLQLLDLFFWHLPFFHPLFSVQKMISPEMVEEEIDKKIRQQTKNPNSNTIFVGTSLRSKLVSAGPLRFGQIVRKFAAKLLPKLGQSKALVLSSWYKVGPLPVINAVITPKSRVKYPQLPFIFGPFIGVSYFIYNDSDGNDSDGAHLVCGVRVEHKTLPLPRKRGEPEKWRGRERRQASTRRRLFREDS